MDSCETNRDHVVRDLLYLKSYGKVSNNQTIYEIAESALELLKEQEERTKGHWMPGKDWANEHYCSECHYRAIMKKLDWQYCPRCGANMRL